MFCLRNAVLVAALSIGAAVAAEPAPANGGIDEAQAHAEMRELQEYLGPGKRAFVEQQLSLTPEESAKFWPIYDKHQAGLAALNKRRLDNILSYARQWNSDSLSDTSADSLATQALAIERDEAALMESTYRSLKGVIPAIRAARYLQVEYKLRAIVRFDQAAQVPLAM